MFRPTRLLMPLLLALIASCGGSGAPAATDGLPTVTGEYGSKPTLAFPSVTPPSELMSTVLREGTGPVVVTGDLLVADYLGQVWKGEVFDNSYDRKKPTGFVIGSGKVIPGWDKVLVGVKAGSRVLMSLPPADGYGAQGNADAGIKGTDTLVFVVDVVASYGKTAAGDVAAVAQQANLLGVTVTGALGKAAAVTVAKTAVAPTTPERTILAEGTGPAVESGLLIVQYAATQYNGTPAGDTYSSAPAAIGVGADGGGTPFDLLVGVPLGSRVLLRLPSQGTQLAVAIVVDLIAQPRSASVTG
ncbi:MAG: FKBP-type peptidyl-prolyl cis-trans isomerase [Mycobacteriales bacterium]